MTVNERVARILGEVLAQRRKLRHAETCAYAAHWHEYEQKHPRPRLFVRDSRREWWAAGRVGQPACDCYLSDLAAVHAEMQAQVQAEREERAS